LSEHRREQAGKPAKTLGLAVGCSRLFPDVPGIGDRKRTAELPLRSPDSGGAGDGPDSNLTPVLALLMGDQPERDARQPQARHATGARQSVGLGNRNLRS
jgi:hypothetical protein